MSPVIKGQSIILSMLKPEGTISDTECIGGKKKCKGIWRKDHRNTTFWVQMMSQKENDTKDVHMHVHSSQMIKAVCKNDIARFNPRKCKGKVGYVGCIIQVSLLGRVEHLAGLFFAQRKETNIKEICFSFY